MIKKYTFNLNEKEIKKLDSIIKNKDITRSRLLRNLISDYNDKNTKPKSTQS